MDLEDINARIEQLQIMKTENETELSTKRVQLAAKQQEVSELQMQINSSLWSNRPEKQELEELLIAKKVLERT